MYDRIRPYLQQTGLISRARVEHSLLLPCFFPQQEPAKQADPRARALDGLHFVPILSYFVHQEQLSGLCISRLSAIKAESSSLAASKPHK
jgi:hypothetical protein